MLQFIAPFQLLHPERPEQESAPYDKKALAGEVKHFPVPKPGGDECAVRTHGEELPIHPEGEIGM